ncbi:hypothetical protein M5K25_020978 [Dendrobium thyrsiflorum]|uniref:Uncharacterized protein n=1 Tax=Dendrobium thyrsiflorum TaxID=117978 RepID=A0ABD0UB91_DENTH
MGRGLTARAGNGAHLAALYKRASSVIVAFESVGATRVLADAHGLCSKDESLEPGRWCRDEGQAMCGRVGDGLTGLEAEPELGCCSSRRWRSSGNQWEIIFLGYSLWTTAKDLDCDQLELNVIIFRKSIASLAFQRDDSPTFTGDFSLLVEASRHILPLLVNFFALKGSIHRRFLKSRSPFTIKFGSLPASSPFRKNFWSLASYHAREKRVGAGSLAILQEGSKSCEVVWALMVCGEGTNVRFEEEWKEGAHVKGLVRGTGKSRWRMSKRLKHSSMKALQLKYWDGRKQEENRLRACLHWIERSIEEG